MSNAHTVKRNRRLRIKAGLTPRMTPFERELAHRIAVKRAELERLANRGKQ